MKHKRDKFKIHTRHLAGSLLKDHFSQVAKDLGKVRRIVTKFNFITCSSLNKAIKEVPWLTELFTTPQGPKSMSWSVPYYSKDELPAMIKELKSIEPLVAKLRVAGVL